MEFCLWPFGSLKGEGLKRYKAYIVKSSKSSKSEPLQRYNDSTVQRTATSAKPLSRRSLPCGCALRVPLGARKLFRPRSCPFWLPPPPRRRLFPPCRPRERLPPSLWAENPPCIRSRDKSRCALFAGQTL